MLGIQVTSTEGYPHLYPAWKRRGFLYKDIVVCIVAAVCGSSKKLLLWKFEKILLENASSRTHVQENQDFVEHLQLKKYTPR